MEQPEDTYPAESDLREDDLAMSEAIEAWEDLEEWENRRYYLDKQYFRPMEEDYEDEDLLE
jgi:hypothetical protein